MERQTRRFPGTIGGWLAAGIAASFGLLWFGYHAIQEWQQSAVLLAEKHSSEAADLLIEAITRDMRGVQETILSSSAWERFAIDRPYEMNGLVAGAFASYPYPESFFAWRADRPPDELWFFNRADNRPSWLSRPAGQRRFPVIFEHEPGLAKLLIDRIADDIRHGRQLSIFDLAVNGTNYQVVTRLVYTDAFQNRLQSLVGFTVNLPWAHAHYVADLTRQVWEIGKGTEKGLNLGVIDSNGSQVVGETSSNSGVTSRRTFALGFFDADSINVLSGPTSDLWTVQVSAAGDPTLSQAIAAANRTMVIGVVSALMLVAGLILTARAQRASARLSEMRSDFVSAVTHELKTPIASIQAAAQTLQQGRLTGSNAFSSYADLVVSEAKRLSRLVENLLAYSRITDVADAYAFEALDVGEVVRDIQNEFEVLLDQGGFEVHVDLPDHMPGIRGDRLALRLLLNNLVDNAIRYSHRDRFIEFAAHQNGSKVMIEVRDRGIGIPANETDLVTRRFLRGRGAPSSGSGLGLAIASRIAQDHGGALTIKSIEGSGTTVTVAIPVAES